MIQVAKIALVKTLQKVVAFIPKVKTSGTAGVVSLTPIGNTLKLTLSYPEATIESLCTAVSVQNPPERMSLSGQKFLAMVAAADKEILLDVVNSSLEVKSGKSKWVEPMSTPSDRSITLPDAPAVTFDVYPLLTALNTVKYALESDAVRPSLYMIDIKDGLVRACNGFQYHEVDTKISDLTFSIPGGMAESFMAVLRYFDGSVEFYMDEDYYYFKNKTDTIAVRRLQLTFPDLDRLLVKPLKSDSPALLQVNKSALVKALKQVKLVTDDNYPYVELHLSQKEVLLRCTAKLGSESVASINGKWAAKPRVATFNVSHLSQTLNSLPDGVLEVRFGTDTKKKKSPLVVEGAGSWTMLNQANLSLRA